MPVPRWGSRSTRTPALASPRATCRSSGVDSESPVTNTVCSARRGGGGVGSNASRVTIGICPATSSPPRVAKRPPAASCGSGERGAVRRAANACTGSRREIHPTGRSTPSTSARPALGLSSWAALGMEDPNATASTSAATPTATRASRARKRRAFSSKRFIRLSSDTSSPQKRK